MGLERIGCPSPNVTVVRIQATSEQVGERLDSGKRSSILGGQSITVQLDFDMCAS